MRFESIYWCNNSVQKWSQNELITLRLHCTNQALLFISKANHSTKKRFFSINFFHHLKKKPCRGEIISPWYDITKWWLWLIAPGHFEKNQQKLSKNQSDDAHICKSWTKFFMYILSIPKFGIVYVFSGRLKKLHLGRIS